MAATKPRPRATGRFHDLVRSAKRDILAKALARAGGNVRRAAVTLELERTYLYVLIRELQVPRPRRAGGGN